MKFDNPEFIRSTTTSLRYSSSDGGRWDVGGEFYLLPSTDNYSLFLASATGAPDVVPPVLITRSTISQAFVAQYAYVPAHTDNVGAFLTTNHRLSYVMTPFGSGSGPLLKFNFRYMWRFDSSTGGLSTSTPVDVRITLPLTPNGYRVCAHTTNFLNTNRSTAISNLSLFSIHPYPYPSFGFGTTAPTTGAIPSGYTDRLRLIVQTDDNEWDTEVIVSGMFEAYAIPPA